MFDSEIGLMLKISIIRLGAIQDTFGPGPSGADQIEEKVTDHNRLLRNDLHHFASLQDGKGIWFNRSIFPGYDAIEAETVDLTNSVDAIVRIAGYQGDRAVFLAYFMEQRLNTRVQTGVFGGVEFVFYQDVVRSKLLFWRHLRHGFQDWALSNADFGSDLIEVEVWLSYGAVEVENNCSNFHVGRMLY